MSLQPFQGAVPFPDEDSFVALVGVRGNHGNEHVAGGDVLLDDRPPRIAGPEPPLSNQTSSPALPRLLCRRSTASRPGWRSSRKQRAAFPVLANEAWPSVDVGACPGTRPIFPRADPQTRWDSPLRTTVCGLKFSRKSRRCASGTTASVGDEFAALRCRDRGVLGGPAGRRIAPASRDARCRSGGGAWFAARRKGWPGGRTSIPREASR